MSSASVHKRYTSYKSGRRVQATPEVIQARREKSLKELRDTLLVNAGLIAAVPLTGGLSAFGLLPGFIHAFEKTLTAISPDEYMRVHD